MLWGKAFGPTCRKWPHLKKNFFKPILLVLPMLGKKSGRMHVKLDSGDPPKE